MIWYNYTAQMEDKLLTSNYNNEDEILVKAKPMSSENIRAEQSSSTYLSLDIKL